jgi:hypothetical protein
MTLPLSVGTDGNVKITVVLTIANTAAPTAAELNAGTTVPADGYITGDGYSASAEQATVADERIGTTQTFEQPGRKTKSLSLTYVHNPASPTNNALFLALTEGADVYVVTRFGLPRTTTHASAQKVQVWPVKCGEPMPQYNGANSVQTITQKLFVTGDVKNPATVA